LDTASDIDKLADTISLMLADNNGVLALSDKTSPEVIDRIFGVSKKNFKKALGILKNRELISIHKDRISTI
jgi:predicted RNA-binding protein (virulence factor B family)